MDSINIKKLIIRRKELKKTQADLANFLKISRQSYNMREKEKVPFTLREFEDVCRYLDLLIIIAEER
jgi:DNA-binding XRE family transcriptional regulator